MRAPSALRRKPLKIPALPERVARQRRPCVVHLVRAANGPPALRAFATALRRHPPGIAYDLVLAMKGFESSGEARTHLDEVADLEPETLFFPDAGLDLGVYFAAAACLRRARYCFLNSYSTPLSDRWLEMLDAALDRPRVGVVGATGSWASTRSWMAYSLGLPSAYRGSLPPVAIARAQLLASELDETVTPARSARDTLRARTTTLRQLPELERFPAYHLRTNAFMITHATLQRLRLRVVRNKVDAYALENGRRSITRQVQALGLQTLVVDCAGRTYGHAHWDRSRTFWQGDQEGLLVADNRTRAYQRGDRLLRQVLAGVAWGPSASPGVAQNFS